AISRASTSCSGVTPALRPPPTALRRSRASRVDPDSGDSQRTDKPRRDNKRQESSNKLLVHVSGPHLAGGRPADECRAQHHCAPVSPTCAKGSSRAAALASFAGLSLHDTPTTIPTPMRLWRGTEEFHATSRFTRPDLQVWAGAASRCVPGNRRRGDRDEPGL